MSLLQSEFINLQTAIEAVNGTLPSVGWQVLEPEPDGLDGFYRQIKKLARSPLSSNLMDEKGDAVDEDATIKLVHDFDKDIADQYGSSIFRSLVKFPGGTGTGRWINRPDASGALVTAVTSSQFTVSAGGALPANVLVYARGFSNPQNNGLFVVQAASTGTAVKVTGTVAEASPPAGATVEVVGYQGASADLTISATGLASTTVDFTTLGLQQWSAIWVGGGTAAAPGAFGFATANNRGLARMTSISAHAITTDRQTQAWSTDTGTGKTIQLFFGPWARNVPGVHADYLRSSHSFELLLPGVGSGGVTDYIYVDGCGLGTLEINAALTQKLVATLGFTGFNVLDPTVTRTTGASNGLGRRGTAMFNTVGHEKRLRVYDTNNTQVLADFESWKLTINNNIKPYKAQGYQGNKDLIFGKFQASLSVDGAITQDDLWKAVGDNRTLAWDALVRNNDAGVWFDLPATTVEDANPKFPANDLAQFSPMFKCFRDPVSNFVCGMTVFPFLPAS